MPATAFAMIAQTGDVCFGLWYPIAIALATVVIGTFMIPATKDRDIFAENEDGSASTCSHKAAAQWAFPRRDGLHGNTAARAAVFSHALMPAAACVAS